MTAGPIDHDKAGSLFVDDDTLHRKVAPYMGRDSFRALLKVWEAEGFPKKKSSVRGRYWLACKAWLDQRYGVSGNADVDEAEDGKEDFDAAPGRKARTQDRASRPAVLVRETGGAGHQRLPGQVHSLADRRK
jgi:hypothetical protein